MFTKVLLIILLFLAIITTGCSPTKYVIVRVPESVSLPKSVFAPYEFELSRDFLITHGIKISSMAQRYYEKAAVFSGGNLSFIGFDIPLCLQETKHGKYTSFVATGQKLTINIVGNIEGYDCSNPISYRIDVTRTSITVVLLN